MSYIREKINNPLWGHPYINPHTPYGGRVPPPHRGGGGGRGRGTKK